jgi:type VI secretion system secreted protein VgrG
MASHLPGEIRVVDTPLSRGDGRVQWRSTNNDERWREVTAPRARWTRWNREIHANAARHERRNQRWAMERDTTNLRDTLVRLESSRFACDRLQITALRGREALGAPFEFEIDVAVLDPGGLDVEAVVGAEATIVFEKTESPVRRVHGIVDALTDLLRVDDACLEYRLRLVPRAHRLTLVETQEVFLGKSVPDIILEKLARAGLQGTGDVHLRLQTTYPPRDIVVQYRESDLAFVSRLAESAGITIRFDHDGDRDRLVLSDHNQSFGSMAGDARLPFMARAGEAHVSEIAVTRAMAPARHYVVDYNDQHPRLDLKATHNGVPEGASGEVVEYGAMHRSPDEGKQIARIRNEERAANNGVYSGRSNAAGLEPGRTFGIDGHPRLDKAGLLVVEVEHAVVQPLANAAGERARREAVTYENRFRAIPAETPYRPPRVTARPRICGVLHAITQGAPGATSKRVANIDDQGRYTVRFYFDMTPQKDRAVSSPPVRMLQPHAGPGYGFHFPLKPDVEVMVAFVDGDPDRPVIVGAVPNPLTQSVVTAGNARTNKIMSESGLVFMMKDRAG